MKEQMRRTGIDVIGKAPWGTHLCQFYQSKQDLIRGYEGLRLSGNTFWLEDKDWADFTTYEETVNSVIGNYHMLAVCTYSLVKCGAPEIMDVVSNHRFALIKRAGRWQMIESSEHKKTEAALAE